MVKADSSVLIHSDGGSYKPLNWMAPPATVHERAPEPHEQADGVTAVWEVAHAKTDEFLRIELYDVIADLTYDLGIEPGLMKDGVEAHLQKLLAEQVFLLGRGFTLVRREYPTPIGPVDLMCQDDDGAYVAVEVKRRGEIAGVEQLARYLEQLDKDPRLAPVRGIFAAQEIKPQARTLADDRGIECVILDYDAMRGLDDPSTRLF